MVKIPLYKSLALTLAIVFFCATTTFSQFVVHYTLSNPYSGFNGYSSNLSDDIAQQIARQASALQNMHYSDYRREVARFDRRLVISANVVRKMELNKDKASRYTYVNTLYKRSLQTYKQLEELSQKAAANANQNKSIKDFQSQQASIIEKALDDYHKAEGLITLDENKSRLIKEAAEKLSNDYQLSVFESDELKKEMDKIRSAENKIKELKAGSDALKDSKKNLEAKAIYQTVAQSILTLNKMIQKIIEAINPDKKTTEAFKVGLAAGEKFIEEYIENGKSPEIAIREAFQNGYEKLRQEEFLKKTPALKNILKVPMLVNDLVKQIDKWEKIEKNQRETLHKIDEVIKFTEEGIKFNEKLINRSKAKSATIIERSITKYLNKPQMP